MAGNSGANGSPHPLDIIGIARAFVSFCPDKSFLFVAGISRTTRGAWGKTRHGRQTVMCGEDTTPYQVLVSIAHLGLPTHPGVCRAAARRGKLRCLVSAVGQGCQVDESVSEAAALGGSTRVLQWLWDRECGFNHEKICVASVKSGSMDAIRWCREKDLRWTNECCLVSARHGCLDVLTYLVGEGCHLAGPEICVYSGAIRGGHIHILKYLSTCNVEQFVWNDQAVFDRAVTYSGKSLDERAVFMAKVLDLCATASISVNDLTRLVLLGPKHFWLVETCFSRVEGYPNNIDLTQSIVVDSAVSQGSIYMVDYLMGRGFPCDDNTILSRALQSGQMDLLRTLISRGKTWTEASDRTGFQVAAFENRLADLETCMTQPGGGVIFGNGNGGDLCSRAAENGANDVLRFALEKTTGYKDENICSGAVQTGSLETTNIAVEGGAPLSPNCVVSAVEDGNASMLEYLISCDCPVGEEDLIELAATFEHLDVLNLLLSARVVPVSPAIVESVVSSGSCRMLQWAFEICGTFSDEALYQAAGMEDCSPLKLLYTRVGDARWRRVYPGLLSMAIADDVEKWIESTRYWD